MANNKHISIGRVGEDIAAKFLENRGYRVTHRNYRKKCGEIDIVAHKDKVIHIVEVKAASWTGNWPKEGADLYRPEDNLHKQKRARLGRVMALYLSEYPPEADEVWTLDLVIVLLNTETQHARIQVLWDVLLD
jgi:putative endonuclease